MKKLILIIGAPGSGKTSTSEKVQETLNNVSHYSMGEIFRNEVTNKTEIAETVDKFMKKGITVPINIAINAIKNAINTAPTKNVIIDGYPRDEEQLNEFNGFIKSQNKIELSGLIEIKVSEDNAKKRILSRKGRNDDNLKIFAERMIYYKKYRDTIVLEYEKTNKYFYINGNNNFENAVNQLKELTKNIFNL